MDLILKNPFRVLGLPATSTSREIAKRISDLEMFAELGKIKSYPFDFTIFGDIHRDVDSIKDAARKIESAEGRLLHSFFWFRSSDSVDELALDSLNQNMIDEAINLWSKQIDKTASENYTWRLNRSVLLFLQSTASTSVITSYFDRALEDLGYVVDDYLDESVESVLAGNEAGLNRDHFCKNIIDELLDFLKKSKDQPYGNALVGLLGSFSEDSSFWSFSEEMENYAHSKIISPLVDEVKNAIHKSEEFRENSDNIALKNRNNLEKVEWIINDLYQALDDNDVRLQSLANSYVDEILACSVCAYNDLDDEDLSLALLNWADSLPCYGRMIEVVEDKKKSLLDAIKERNLVNRYGKVISELTDDNLNFYDLPRKIDFAFNELSVTKKSITLDERSEFLDVSSFCVNKTLDVVIDFINNFKDQIGHGKDFSDFKLALERSLVILEKLGDFDLHEDSQIFLSRSYQDLKELHAAVKNQLNVQGGGSRYGVEQVEKKDGLGGWWIVIIICFIFYQCSHN